MRPIVLICMILCTACNELADQYDTAPVDTESDKYCPADARSGFSDPQGRREQMILKFRSNDLADDNPEIEFYVD